MKRLFLCFICALNVVPLAYLNAQNNHSYIITGRKEGKTPDQYFEWEWDTVKHVLSVSGPGCNNWDGSWKNITTVKLAADVKDISFIQWGVSRTLKKIQVDKDSKYLALIDGVLTNKTKDTLLLYPGGIRKSKYIIPSSIKCIYYDAIEASIDTLVISSNVKDIKDPWYNLSGIKHFEVKNNPNYSVRYGILCANDTSTFDMFLPSTIEKIPFIAPKRFLEEVTECTKDGCIFKGHKPVVLIFCTKTQTESIRLVENMSLIYAEFKDVVDFYRVEINRASGAAAPIQDIFKMYYYPSMCIFDGEYQGEPHLYFKKKGNIMFCWHNYDAVRNLLLKLLSERKTRTTQNER